MVYKIIGNVPVNAPLKSADNVISDTSRQGFAQGPVLTPDLGQDFSNALGNIQGAASQFTQGLGAGIQDSGQLVGVVSPIGGAALDAAGKGIAGFGKSFDNSNETAKPAAGTQPDLSDVAKRVERGDFGDGTDREAALKQAGYDPQSVQTKVNEDYGYNPEQSAQMAQHF